MDTEAREPGGHPFGPVAECAEGEDLVVRVDQHGMVGCRAARRSTSSHMVRAPVRVSLGISSPFWPHLVAVPDPMGDEGTI